MPRNEFYGQVRGTSLAPNLGEGDQRAALGSGGEWLTVPGLPPKTELVRLGGSDTCRLATGTAFTFVAAWPTTRAELVLYNGEAETTPRAT